MPGYIVALNDEQLAYLINLIEEDMCEISGVKSMDPSWVLDQILEIQDFRDYLQSIYNTGGNAK